MKYTVRWSNNGIRYSSSYSTEYHAAQFLSALLLNGIKDAVIFN